MSGASLRDKGSWNGCQAENVPECEKVTGAVILGRSLFGSEFKANLGYRNLMVGRCRENEGGREGRRDREKCSCVD